MGSIGGGNSSNSAGAGAKIGVGDTNILQNMMNHKNNIPANETLFGRMRSFATSGSNQRTLSRGEADYPGPRNNWVAKLPNKRMPAEPMAPPLT